jgi:MtN3 and saliva related transmembrane protein
VPQVLQVVRSRDTKSISLLMYMMYSAGVALWIYFGVLIGSLSVIVCNVVTLALALVILGMKIRLG